MPWQESTVVNERETFVLRALEPGANVAELCREAGISRKTAYKWLQRSRGRGMEGLHDLLRRPHMSPLRCPGEVVLRIIDLRRAHPRWGPKKLHAVLRPRTPFHPAAFESRMVNAKGYVKLRGQRYYVRLAVAGRAIGLLEIEPGQFSRRYFDHDLGVLTVAA